MTPSPLSSPAFGVGGVDRRVMLWQRSDRFDPRAVAIADRHYSRQKPGTPQFMRTGSCAVFYADTPTGRAVWGTTWQQHVKHAWPGAWECAIFRNESAGRASELIRQAIAATRWHYGVTPAEGMITLVDASKVRAKANPGHCFIIAGFRPVGFTLGGKLVLHISPARMPDPCAAVGTQASFLKAA